MLNEMEQIICFSDSYKRTSRTRMSPLEEELVPTEFMSPQIASYSINFNGGIGCIERKPPLNDRFASVRQNKLWIRG